MDLIFDDSSVINTKLMFFVETVKDTVELTLGFFDTYSVAFYLLFLYQFIGPMFMAFSYSFVKLTGFDKRLLKKHGLKSKATKVRVCGGTEYKPLY